MRIAGGGRMRSDDDSRENVEMDVRWIDPGQPPFPLLGAERATKKVGASGFEPPTPSPPDWCANQAAPRPEPYAADRSYM